MATVTEAEAEAEIEASSATEVGPATFPPHRLTVDRFERMVEAGIFGDTSPVFLWRGGLVESMGKGFPHNFALQVLVKILGRSLPDGWDVRQEMPVVVGDASLPEPDLSVVRGGARDYLMRNPSVADVAILIEVADSSLAIDSGDKLEGYAADGIPTYWIVNIPRGRVEVYNEPTGPSGGAASYRSRRDYGPGDDVPVVLDGREVGRVAVREILP